MTLDTSTAVCRSIDWEDQPYTLRELLDGDPVIFEQSKGFTIAFELVDRVIWVQRDSDLSTEVFNLLWAQQNWKHFYDRWWEHRQCKANRAMIHDARLRT